MFQQPNVAASFSVTGLALATFVLLGVPVTGVASRTRASLCLGGALMLLSTVLVWGQSRTGWRVP
ncbi:TPA: hypothetical protein ACKQE3_003225 [Serratia marcescens]